MVTLSVLSTSLEASKIKKMAFYTRPDSLLSVCECVIPPEVFNSYSAE